MNIMSAAGVLLLCADQKLATFKVTFGLFPLLLGLLLIVIGKPLSVWSFTPVSKLLKGKFFQRPAGLFLFYIIAGMLLIQLGVAGVLIFTPLC